MNRGKTPAMSIHSLRCCLPTSSLVMSVPLLLLSPLSRFLDDASHYWACEVHRHLREDIKVMTAPKEGKAGQTDGRPCVIQKSSLIQITLQPSTHARSVEIVLFQSVRVRERKLAPQRILKASAFWLVFDCRLDSAAAESTS